MKKKLAMLLTVLMLIDSSIPVLAAMAEKPQSSEAAVENLVKKVDVIEDDRGLTVETADEYQSVTDHIKSDDFLQSETEAEQNPKNNTVYTDSEEKELNFNLISAEDKYYQKKLNERNQKIETANLLDEYSYSGECGENAYWKLEDDTLTISGTGEMDFFWMSGNGYLESRVKRLIINDGITSIGSFSFYENLTEVKIPDSVKVIQDEAFLYCKSLTQIDIPDSVESIGEEAFRGCYGLTEFKISAFVSNIGRGAFAAIENLEKITVDKNNQWYCTDAYGALYNTAKTVLLCFPNGNKSTEYIIADTVETIGKYAFGDNKTLSSIRMPASLKVIEDSAFCECIVENIKLYNGIKEICEGAFSSCSNLTGINLPDSLEIIGEAAFMQTGLHNIYIPASVKTIGKRAFFNGLRMEKITVSSENMFYSSDDYGALFDKKKNVLIFLPGRELGSKVKYTVPSSVTEIADMAAWQMHGIGTIEIPASVTQIGENAFEMTCDLSQITVSENNPAYSSDDKGVLFNKDKTVLIHCPTGCSFEEYRIPNTVTTILDAAFCHGLFSTNLKRLYIPVSVKKMEDNAFKYFEGGETAEIYYDGTEEQWNSIEMSRWGFGDNIDYFNNANIVFKEIYNTSKDDGYKQDTKRFGQGVSLYVYDKWTSKPLSGATVKIGDYEAVSGEDGIVNFPDVKLRTKYVVECTAENYFTTTYLDVFYNAGSDKNFLGMTAYKNSSKSIKVSSVFYGIGNKVYGDLTNGNSVTVAKTDTDTYFLKVNVDWGKFQPGTIKLYAEKSKKTLDFKNNKLLVKIGEEFDVGETFNLILISGDGKSKFTKKLVLKTQTLPKETKIDIPELTSEPIPGNFPFFGGAAKESFNFGVDLNELLKTNPNANVSMDDENVVITIDFGGENVESFYANIWGDKEVEGTIGVKIIIPVTDLKGGKWAGYLTFKSGNKVNFDKKANYVEFVAVNKTYWIETPFGVLPVYLKLDLSSMVDAELGIAKEDTLHSIDGNLTVGITGRISGGLGVAYNTFEITCGPYGKATAEINMSDINLNTPTLKPHIELNFGVQLSAKAWFLNAGAEFEMGKWEWPKDDADLLMQHELESTELALFERDYSQNPNVFLGEESAELYNSSESEVYSDKTILTNVLPTVQGKILYLDGKKILVFNNDNTERDIQNGLMLMFSEFVDGAWSRPVAVCDDGTMDSQISSDGKFVVWENSNKQFGKDENNWISIMSCQEIAVSKYDGNKFENQVILTNNDIADYAPTVAAYGDKAIVAWLSNSESDIFGSKGTTSVHYCIYDGQKWGEVETVNNVGTVTRVEAQYNDDVSKIVFANQNGLNVLNTDENKIDIIYADKFDYFTCSPDGVYLITEGGDIWFAGFNKERQRIASGAECISCPQFVESEGVSYLLWTQSADNGVSLHGIQYDGCDWSKVIKYYEGCFDIVSPSASPSGNGVSLCYINRENANNLLTQDDIPEKFICNLNIAEITPRWDVVIEKVGYSENEIEYEIRNCGTQSIDGLKLSVSQDILICAEKIYPQIKADDVFTGKISVNDFDNGSTALFEAEVMGTDNDIIAKDSYRFNPIASDMKVISANILKDQNEKYNIICEVVNDGVITDPCVTVEVKENNFNGKVLYSETYENVLPKEKIVLKCDVDNSFPQYYVCVSGDSDNNRYNNFSVCYRMGTSVTGDLNGDETVDIEDAILLFRHSMLPELYPINYTGNIDYNHDGNVDIDDAILLFQYSMLPDLYPIE